MSELYTDTVKRFEKYVVPTYAPKQLFVRGEGAKLYDDEGVEFLDFAAGISVCNLGHCNPRVTRAIQEQAAKLVHVSNLYMNELMPRLAEKLVESSFPGKAFFCNSGAEANEGMIKLARKYGNTHGGRNEIITMENSFHGRTLATLAATGRAKYRKGFEPDVPGFKQVPFNDFDALKAAITGNTCAVMLEMVQGEGGILPADEEYLAKVRQLCDERDILMLCDEVQCGMGRIGTRFAFQSFDVVPDVVSMAKAIANGLPMGGFIVRDKFADTLTVELITTNESDQPFTISQALHTYFQIGAIEEIAIDGVGGKDYLDKVGGGCVERTLAEGPLTVHSEVDYVFKNAPGPFAIRDAKLARTIAVTTEGSNSAVVWNPWIEKSKKMSDYLPNSYLDMVCVETCNAADDARTVAPHATHSLKAVYTIR